MNEPTLGTEQPAEKDRGAHHDRKDRMADRAGLPLLLSGESDRARPTRMGARSQWTAAAFKPDSLTLVRMLVPT